MYRAIITVVKEVVADGEADGYEREDVMVGEYACQGRETFQEAAQDAATAAGAVGCLLREVE